MLLCTFALAAAGPAVARAQDPGVTVDPNSPSGKEYALPLDSARRAAEPATGHATTPKTGSTAPLFGAGISRSAAPRSRAGGAPASARTRRPARRTRTKPRAGVAAPATVRLAAQTPGAPAGGIGSQALAIGAGIAVLLAGAGAGLLLRRRTRG